MLAPITVIENMTSAALPPLPSTRARELERTSATYKSISSAPVDSRNQVDESANNADIIGPETDNQVVSNNYNNNPLSNKSTQQSEVRRSNHLATLHKKEQKVFGGLPPLESSVACNAIHHHLSTTSAFLNSFIADANASHEGIDHKLTVLERQMALLESKIVSMPDLFPEEEVKDDESTARQESKSGSAEY